MKEVASQSALEAASKTGRVTPDQPTGSAHRLVTLDFMRGIAVLGILFANITAFGQPHLAYFWPKALAQPMDAVDQAVWLFQFVFVDGKFRGIFTLLFGAGLYLFMERAWARGAGVWLQFWRLFFLLLFGLAHYFLIWRGDILTLYAVWGMAALPLLGMSAERQLSLGVTLLVFGVLLNGASLADSYFGATDSASADEATAAYYQQYSAELVEKAQEELRLYQQGSYGEIVSHTVREETGRLIRQVTFTGLTETLGLMLVGMALYRLGLFSGGVRRGALLRWGWGGISVGWLLSLAIGLWPFAEGFPFYATLFAFNGLAPLPQLITVLGLVALIAAYAPTVARGWFGQRLAAAGRMAFSNYLGTSLIMMVVFHGWALGLFGLFGRLELLGIVLVTWALMLAWSKPWLMHFRYGPLEWIWRCLTYRRLFPLRRKACY